MADEPASPEINSKMANALKRDMDLIRSLLLEMEAGKVVFLVVAEDVGETIGIAPEDTLPKEEAARLEMHLDLLEDAGLVEFQRGSAGLWRVVRITWAGHEFLESVRDGEVWKRVKLWVEKVGNGSLAVILELTKAAAKTVASERLGMDLG